MTRRILSIALALGALTVPAAAEAKVAVGIGDQKYEMYADSRLYWLGIKHTRIIVSWEVARVSWERWWIDRWLKNAQFAGIQPLVGFGHAWPDSRRRKLPSVAQYKKAVSDFHAKYPWVTDYIAWNEANHCSQPTCHKPGRAAAYFDALVDVCPTCNIVAADVLDQGGMEDWLRAFRRAAHHTPTIWGLHNYLDVNRLRSTGTRRLLRAVKGEVWITETGGVVARGHYRGKAQFEESPSHAGKATRYALNLAAAMPRITRVYLYHWRTETRGELWDSGLLGPRGHVRPGFLALARFLGRDVTKAPPQDPPPPEFPPEQQPPTQEQPSPSEPPPSEPPPECFLLPPLCG